MKIYAFAIRFIGKMFEVLDNFQCSIGAGTPWFMSDAKNESCSVKFTSIHSDGMLMACPVQFYQ